MYMKTYLKSSVFIYFTLLGFAVNAVYFKYAFSVCYIVEVVGLAMMQALLFAAPIVQYNKQALMSTVQFNGYYEETGNALLVKKGEKNYLLVRKS